MNINSRSDKSVPTTVRKLRNITVLPARKLSWLIRAPYKRGPVVGRFRTMAVMVSPETMTGRVHPMVLTIGLIATLTGYLKVSRRSDKFTASRARGSGSRRKCGTAP